MKVPLDKIFVGESIPISDLKIMRGNTKYDWEEIFASIPHGHGREVSMTCGAIERAIKRFEEKGTIKQGEFGIRRKNYNKPDCRIWILHYEKD